MFWSTDTVIDGSQNKSCAPIYYEAIVAAGEEERNGDRTQDVIVSTMEIDHKVSRIDFRTRRKVYSTADAAG